MYEIGGTCACGSSRRLITKQMQKHSLGTVCMSLVAHVPVGDPEDTSPLVGGQV
jgi:hypothetical protein